ncbi:MAG: hypothetical protein R2911_00100 [Caldilineaceae bacterium]
MGAPPPEQPQRQDRSVVDFAARTDDAYVYLGFQYPPTPRSGGALWMRKILTPCWPALNAFPWQPGDVLLVAGGVPHAIGPGITMVEIQEPTDYVVRCEYAHGGAVLPESARTMGLGLDRVLDLFDYTQYPAADVKERFGPRRALFNRAPAEPKPRCWPHRKPTASRCAGWNAAANWRCTWMVAFPR